MEKLKCLTCNEEKGLEYFTKTKNKGNNKEIKPYHYWVKKCKKCLGYKTLKGEYNKTTKPNQIERKIEKGVSISNDTKVFLKRLKMKKGYVDMLDAYKLAHFFTETFGYIDIDYLEVEDQLILMYEKLIKANGNTTI